MDNPRERILEFLGNNRVAVFIVAYNAEKHIESVLGRIPEFIARNLAEIYIIDDSSADGTLRVARELSWPPEYAPLRIYRTPYNQGYGGNQKLGYAYALQNNFDVVILLHGDGQYAPESLPDIIAPYLDGYDAVFGSRFLGKGKARKGGMPLYKWLGNRILTSMQNRLLGSRMSEMHSGYRSYRVDALRHIPFAYNANDFHFDAEIILQLHEARVQDQGSADPDLLRRRDLPRQRHRLCMELPAQLYPLPVDEDGNILRSRSSTCPDRLRSAIPKRKPATSLHAHVRRLSSPRKRS